MRPTTRILRALLGGAGAATVVAGGLAATTLQAQAVSGGGYDPSQQGCSKTADRNDQQQSAQPGCHNATLQVNSGSGTYAQRWHVASVNSDQLPNGQSPHAGSIALDPGMGTGHALVFDTGTGSFVVVNPIGFATDVATWIIGGGQGPFPLPQQLLGPPPSSPPSVGVQQSSAAKRNATDLLGSQVYFGADDNLDNGEHDGVNPTDDHHKDARVANGPSDGGAVQANTHAQGSAGDPASLIAENVDPTDPHDPVRAADAGTGACADGFCAGADTMRRKAYQGGCSTCADQSVYNDQNSTDWRSPDCNSGSTANQNDCGAGWQTGSEQGNIYQPYSERGAYYTDPGVFVYEDPDPQASPALPQYPVCELYAGTMGVWVCSMQVVPSPAAVSPPATGAEQVTTAAPHTARGGMRTQPVVHATPAVTAPAATVSAPAMEAPPPSTGSLPQLPVAPPATPLAILPR
ncbi:MAG TPA: hypothetical protein VFC09_04085 [Candidatus Dormibacteraeota bacterium]|nr:hypothetical protein [Candidatus Dormibacteraeota bacterium]